METAYREIITAIGEDPSRPGLQDTPKRAAKAMEFLMRGYRQDILDERAGQGVAGVMVEESGAPIILGREMGLRLELSDVQLESLVPRALASGTYLVRLQSGTQTRTRAVVVLR